MDAGKRVWKWASAVLGILLAALAVTNFLLTRPDTHTSFETDLSDTPQEVQRPESRGEKSETSSASRSLPGETPKVAAEKHAASSASRLNRARNPESVPFTQAIPKTESAHPAITNHKSPITNLTRPLGIVHQADGRLQAIIQDGEWTQLVEEGQTLADNSRVIRITAEGVELLRPEADARVELDQVVESPAQDLPRTARSTEPIEGQYRRHTAAEPAETTEASTAKSPAAWPELPGWQPVQASHVIPKPPAGTEAAAPTEIIEQPTQGANEVHPQSVLGLVRHSDGRTQAVVADGQWVKLAPETARPEVGEIVVTAEVAPPYWLPEQSDLATGPARAGPPPLRPDRSPDGAVLRADGDIASLPFSETGIQDSRSEIQDSVERIGIVEWSDGRVQAVLAEGESIAFAGDSEIVAGTRRWLALLPPPESSDDEITNMTTGPPARTSEEELAGLRSMEGEPTSRAPPEDESFSSGAPDHRARGKPEVSSVTVEPRPPPDAETGLEESWEAGLPGIETAPAASIERENYKRHHLDALGVKSIGAGSGGVPARTPPSTSRGDSAGAVVARDAKSSVDSNASRTRTVEPLGFVRWLDGEAQAVIPSRSSVELVAEGEILPDGFRVTKVSPNGVVMERMEGGELPGITVIRRQTTRR